MEQAYKRLARKIGDISTKQFHAPNDAFNCRCRRRRQNAVDDVVMNILLIVYFLLRSVSLVCVVRHCQSSKRQRTLAAVRCVIDTVRECVSCDSDMVRRDHSTVCLLLRLHCLSLTSFIDRIHACKMFAYLMLW